MCIFEKKEVLKSMMKPSTLRSEMKEIKLNTEEVDGRK